jgi:CRP/FNR family transcriptional regulator, anaerobic regulatory protein
MLFSSVGTAGLSRRLHSVQDLSVPTGARIITAGEDADAIFTVRAGYLKLWLTAPGGTERIVRLLKRGDVLGLECLVRRQYSLSAGAIADSQLCRIPIEVVDDIKRTDPNLHRELERRWHTQLARTDQFIATVVCGPSPLRVLKLLQYLAAFARPEVCPRVSRLDMAAMLDISSETASRVIADLKAAGLLEETQQHLIFDEARIAVLVDESQRDARK